MVEHLVCCVVVDNLQEPGHVLDFCSTQIFIQDISCQNANFAHCVARMKILCAVFNSEILCSHICENPKWAFFGRKKSHNSCI